MLYKTLLYIQFSTEVNPMIQKLTYQFFNRNVSMLMHSYNAYQTMYHAMLNYSIL